MYEVNGFPSTRTSTRRCASFGTTSTRDFSPCACRGAACCAPTHVRARPSDNSSEGLRMLFPLPQPITTSRLASSNMTFRPLCIAATVMHKATEWLYPASLLALGCLRLRTHSIQFRMLAVVDESSPVLAAVSVGATCD